MRGVDLARYRFDFDLTFAVVLMHPDGHIYHRYGGRDVRSADQWLSEDSWTELLETTLEEHERYAPPPEKAKPPKPQRLEEVPSFARRDKGECIHCHSINEALHEQAEEEDRWNADDIWIYPEPARIGLDLDRDEQRRVTAVEADSPAAEAGLRIGDHILSVGAVPISSASDLMYALDSVPMRGGELLLRYRRGDESSTAQLRLEDGWKRGTPYSFSWRAFKWALDPVPGFGGPALTAEEREELELEEGNFAFRVQYLVTWGPRQRYGRAASKAGLRPGDVVLAIAGKTDFRSVEHFHSWWRLTRKVGETVRIEVRRGHKPITIDLPVIS